MTVVINGTTGIDTGTGSLIAADSTTPTYLDLFEDTDNGSNYVRLIAPTSIASNKTITLPDGTGTVAVNGVSGVLVSGTAQNSTSGTSIDFTGIPSWVKRITVMFNGISTNGVSNIQVQLGDSGGIETTGYLGALLRSGLSTLATTQYPTTGFLIINDVAAADIHSGVAVFSLLGSNNWCGMSQISETAATSFFSGSGAKTLSDTLTQIRITTVNGTDTFDAGTINLMWE